MKRKIGVATLAVATLLLAWGCAQLPAPKTSEASPSTEAPLGKGTLTAPEFSYDIAPTKLAGFEDREYWLANEAGPFVKNVDQVTISFDPSASEEEIQKFWYTHPVTVVERITAPGAPKPTNIFRVKLDVSQVELRDLEVVAPKAGFKGHFTFSSVTLAKIVQEVSRYIAEGQQHKIASVALGGEGPTGGID